MHPYCLFCSFVCLFVLFVCLFVLFVCFVCLFVCLFCLFVFLFAFWLVGLSAFCQFWARDEPSLITGRVLWEVDDKDTIS